MALVSQKVDLTLTLTRSPQCSLVLWFCEPDPTPNPKPHSNLGSNPATGIVSQKLDLTLTLTPTDFGVMHASLV